MTTYTAAPAAGTLKAYALPSLFLLASAAVTWWMVLPGNPLPSAPIVGSCTCWLLLIPAVISLRNLPARKTAAIIMAGAVLLGVAAASAPPRTSNDSARYAWDGIVQKAGISPYALVPADDDLESLRVPWLFQPGTTGPAGDTLCPPDLFGTEEVATTGHPSSAPLCTAINRPHVPTIYPPGAEIFFLTVRSGVPDTAGYLAFQVTGLLVSAAVTGMLLRLLARAEGPVHLAAVWAWSPFVQLEAVNNAHVDLLAAALLLGAGLLLVNGRPLRSGAAFGAAVATKLIPLIAAPALLFRRPAVFIASAAGTFALLYVPYVLASGAGVVGFLPDYLKEEGYSQAGGIRFGLAQLISTGLWPMLLSAAALTVLSIWVLRTTRMDDIWHRQTTMLGLTLLIVSPNYPWYALLLLPFVVLSRRWEYIAVIIALDVIYMLPANPAYSEAVNQTALASAALTVAAAAWRRRRNRYGGPPT